MTDPTDLIDYQTEDPEDLLGCARRYARVGFGAKWTVGDLADALETAHTENQQLRTALQRIAYGDQTEDPMTLDSIVAHAAAALADNLRRAQDWGDPAEVCDDPWVCCIPAHRDYARTLEDNPQ